MLKKLASFVIMFAFLMVSFSVSAEKTIKVGDTAIVPEWERITVMNPTPISNAHVTFYFESTCDIERGGKLTVIAIHEDKLLVRYKIKGEPGGIQCPSGAIFFVSKEKFSQMTERYLKLKEEEKNLRKLVIRLLRKK